MGSEMLSDKLHGQTVTDWSNVEETPLPANIASLLDDVAAKHPERTLWQGIDGDDTELSYAEFGRQSRRLANRFHAIGVRKGTHVALVLPNVAGFFLSWVALCRLGAVAVMVNTSSTSAELARMLKGTAVEFLVIDQQYLHVYEAISEGSRLADGHVIVHGAAAMPSTTSIVAWSTLLEGPAADVLVPEVGLDDIASIQFTSGSSGVPKACMLSHRYWLTLGKARCCIGPTPERMLIDSPLFYMGPLWRIVMALYSGATLYVAPRYSLSRLFERIVDYRIDFCSVTYPVAKLQDDPRLANSSLKWLSTYGLSKDLHVGLEKRFGVPVREIYGMTEVGAALAMPVDDTSMVGSGSCGKPAPFRRLKIVEDGHEVPEGTAGELWISGPAMFSGYYGNPEATEAAFEGEWFKTGDLFRRDANGYYFMLGRIKDIIRRSGENISAAEIELTVNAVEGVLEAAAIPVPDPLRGEEVKIVISRAPGQSGDRLTHEMVHQACRDVLSPFKVPRYVEFVASLPKTPTGKIDKNCLKRVENLIGDGVYDARPDKTRSE